LIIKGIIWFDYIVEKLEHKHHVSAVEVEEFFNNQNQPKIRKLKKGNIKGEDVYAALGQTEAGRFLRVFFILKKSSQALIISARDMDKKELKSYGKK